MKQTSNGICRRTCQTQDHETWHDCSIAAAFDAGWTNALMRLDMWIRSSMKTPGTQVQAVREELIAMANETHTTYLPETQEAIEQAKRGA